jgi:hypothetical protein
MKVSKILALCLMFLLFASTSFAQSIKATGKVTDKADGQPLIGATVRVVGTTTGTSTVLDGSFELTVPAGSKLEVSYIGYTTVTVTAASVMKVELAEDNENLAEVVVTGYMAERKADLTDLLLLSK